MIIKIVCLAQGGATCSRTWANLLNTNYQLTSKSYYITSCFRPSNTTESSFFNTISFVFGLRFGCDRSLNCRIARSVGRISQNSIDASGPCFLRVISMKEDQELFVAYTCNDLLPGYYSWTKQNLMQDIGFSLSPGLYMFAIFAIWVYIVSMSIGTFSLRERKKKHAQRHCRPCRPLRRTLKRLKS